MAPIYPSGINGVLTSYGTSLLMDALFRGASPLDNVWMALLWGIPSASHDGVTMPEVQAVTPDPSGSGQELQTGYARAFYPSQDGNGRMRWIQSSSRSVYNTDAVVFPQAESDWGHVYGWAMTDAIRGGHLIAAGMVDLEVYKGDQVVIDPNNIGLVVIAGV